MEIIDIFLPTEEWLLLQEQFSSDVFPWYFGRKTHHIAQMFDPELIKKEKHNWHLFNLMYSNGTPLTPEYDLILGLINKINPRALIRVKANLTPVCEEIRKFEMHRDINYEETLQEVISLPVQVPVSTTAIYYITDSNGFSYFEDGSRSESIANRLVTFPETTMHCGTTSTDNPRIVLNLNYF